MMYTVVITYKTAYGEARDIFEFKAVGAASAVKKAVRQLFAEKRLSAAGNIRRVVSHVSRKNESCNK